jgi:hypothetical protein
LRTNVVQPEAPVEGIPRRCYNQKRSARFRHRTCCIHPAHNRREVNNPRSPRRAERVSKRGQVAQVVERSPEKAGVGGSTPSLATIISKQLAESRLAFPVRLQSPIFRADPVRFLATMILKDLNSNCLLLSPLSVRITSVDN